MRPGRSQRLSWWPRTARTSVRSPRGRSIPAPPAGYSISASSPALWQICTGRLLPSVARAVASGAGKQATASTSGSATGRRRRLRVVAQYTRPLGFGDVVLPRKLVEGHVTQPLDDAVFVAGKPGVGASELERAAANATRGGSDDRGRQPLRLRDHHRPGRREAVVGCLRPARSDRGVLRARARQRV